MARRILFVLIAVIVIIQFFRPAKNVSGDTAKDISTLYPVPVNVREILDRSCADCHSNKTVYPWYAEVQPVGWWLNKHIKDGKRHFNMNSFADLRAAMQKKRMEDCLDEIKNDEMPLSSYTLIHTNAKLTDPEKATLNTWFGSIIDSLKARYPADSLVLKRRK
jgi:hypothetical protein